MRRSRRHGHAGIHVQVARDDGILDRMVGDHVATGGGRRRFTADEYHRMADVGILCADERLELIDGEIVRMPMIKSPHAAAVDRATRTLVLATGRRAIVRVQGPVHLNQFSEPQPDLVLLRPRDDFYVSAHPKPQDILLAIEIADSSLDYDRERKAPLYARADIVEYWLVDLNGQSVTCYTKPSDGVYVHSVLLQRGHTMTPELLPGLSVLVDDLLSHV